MRSKKAIVLGIAIGLLNSVPMSGAQDVLWQTLMDSADKSLSERNFNGAENQLNAALKALETQTTRNDPNVRTTLRKLATVYDIEGHADQAEAILTKLIGIDEKEHGSSSELARDLNSIAVARRHLNKPADAERDFKRALSILDKDKKADPNTLAAILVNFAVLCQDTGRYEEEEALLKRALSLLQGSGNSADLASVLEQLSKLYMLQNRVAEAEPLLKKSLQLKEKAATASDTADASGTTDSLASLGKLAVEQGDLVQAEKYFKRALSNAEREAKSNDPNLAIAQQNLAQFYFETDKYDKAETLYKAALMIDQAAFGADSREAAKDLSNLALLYVNQGRYRDAEPLYKKSLDMVQAKVGLDHPDTATCMNNLAWLYKNDGRFTQAESLLKQALAIREKVYGKNHPAIARNLANLAGVYSARGQWAQAETLLRQAIDIEQRTLDPSHPDIAVNMRDLASVLEAQKNWVEAEALYRKMLTADGTNKVEESILASDMDGLARALAALDKKSEAQTVANRAAYIKEKLPGAIIAVSTAATTAKRSPSNVTGPTASCPIKDKWALVIGISNFQDPSMNLKYAAKDATDFKNYLVQEGHFQQDHVKLLTDKQATRQNIVDNLGDKWLKRLANPDDLVVIYISTHGSSAKQEAGSANFIVPHDGNLDNIVFNGIPMQWLTAGIKGLVHCDRIVLLLDVCHGGAVADGAKGMRRTSEVDFDSSKIGSGDGQIVVASSQADQISWESKQYANGVFTRRLLEGLRRDGDKTKLRDAFQYMKERVEEEVLRDRAHLQTPVLVTKWWQGEDIAIGTSPINPRPGLTSPPRGVNLTVPKSRGLTNNDAAAKPQMRTKKL